MMPLPIVARELRIAARRPSTYWGRTAAGAAGIAVSFWIALVESGTGGISASHGAWLFWTLSGLVLAYAAMTGLRHSSDSIHREKQEGTLGLLFLTDLRGYDVVLGKLAAGSFSAVYRVVATLPLIAVSLLMGGVSAAEFWRMVVIILNTLFITLGIGILMSAWARTARRAIVATFVILVAIWIGAPVLWWILAVWFEWKGVDWVAGLTPIASLGTAADMSYQMSYPVPPQVQSWVPGILRTSRVTGATIFWFNQAWTHLAGWGGLIAASAILPRLWQDAPRGLPTRVDSAAARQARRAPHLEPDPTFWIGRREEHRPVRLWLTLAAGGLLFIACAVRFGRSFWDAATLILASIVVHWVLKLWIASEAPRRFLEDRRTGALELILTTPIEPPSILRGQFRYLCWHFGGPIAFVLFLDALVLFASRFWSDSDAPGIVTWWVSRMIFLPLDAAALAWDGMWNATTSRGGRAAGTTFARIIVLPWLFLLLISTVGLLGRYDWNEASTTLLLAAWVGSGVLGDVYWILRSRKALTTQFRQLAAVPSGGLQRRRRWLPRLRQAPISRNAEVLP